MEEKKKENLNVEINDQVAEGIYSNLVMINHSQTEFVMDFIQIMPGMPKARVKSRIVLNPQHAKRLLRAMEENVAKYEKTFGEISDNQQPPSLPLNFGPVGEA